jgi:hypothetical protein
LGFLNNTSVTVDAILTKKGRELLAKNDGSFRITQFSLSDDEIDYTLYNPTHPSGSAYYGEAIEAMPILEAFPDETQIMKYKLLTLPRGTAINSTTTIGTNVSRTVIGATINLTATTVNTLFGAQSSLSTILTIIGRDSGARVTIPVTITRVTS